MLCAMFASTEANGQEVKVGIHDRNATYRELFDMVEKQTGMWFAVTDDDFDVSRTVNLPTGAVPLTELLTRALDGTGQIFRISGKHIFIHNADKPAPRITQSVPGTAIRSSVKGGTGNAYTKEESIILVQEGIDSTYKHIVFVPSDGTLKYGLGKTTSSRTVGSGHSILAVKTNLLYGAAALAPNLAFEVTTGRRTTIEISGSYNPWKLDSRDADPKKNIHTIIRPEFRWWTCERFNGHFFGVHAFYANYNVSRYDVPTLFDKEYRYEGTAWGGGVTYGYHLPFAKHWGVEFNIGVGAAHMAYDRYSCVRCDRGSESKTHTYFGPTRAGITLTYIIK